MTVAMLGVGQVRVVVFRLGMSMFVRMGFRALARIVVVMVHIVVRMGMHMAGGAVPVRMEMAFAGYQPDADYHQYQAGEHNPAAPFPEHENRDNCPDERSEAQ